MKVQKSWKLNKLITYLLFLIQFFILPINSSFAQLPPCAGSPYAEFYQHPTCTGGNSVYVAFGPLVLVLNSRERTFANWVKPNSYVCGNPVSPNSQWYTELDIYLQKPPSPGAPVHLYPPGDNRVQFKKDPSSAYYFSTVSLPDSSLSFRNTDARLAFDTNYQSATLSLPGNAKIIFGVLPGNPYYLAPIVYADNKGTVLRAVLRDNSNRITDLITPERSFTFAYAGTSTTITDNATGNVSTASCGPNGTISEITERVLGGKTSTYKIEYGANSNPTKVVAYQDVSTFPVTITYTYGANGILNSVDSANDYLPPVTVSYSSSSVTINEPQRTSTYSFEVQGQTPVLRSFSTNKPNIIVDYFRDGPIPFTVSKVESSNGYRTENVYFSNSNQPAFFGKLKQTTTRDTEQSKVVSDTIFEYFPSGFPKRILQSQGATSGVQPDDPTAASLPLQLQDKPNALALGTTGLGMGFENVSYTPDMGGLFGGLNPSKGLDYRARLSSNLTNTFINQGDFEGGIARNRQGMDGSEDNSVGALPVNQSSIEFQYHSNSTLFGALSQVISTEGKRPTTTINFSETCYIAGQPCTVSTASVGANGQSLSPLTETYNTTQSGNSTVVTNRTTSPWSGVDLSVTQTINRDSGTSWTQTDHTTSETTSGQDNFRPGGISMQASTTPMDNVDRSQSFASTMTDTSSLFEWENTYARITQSGEQRFTTTSNPEDNKQVVERHTKAGAQLVSGGAAKGEGGPDEVCSECEFCSKLEELISCLHASSVKEQPVSSGSGSQSSGGNSSSGYSSGESSSNTVSVPSEF